MQKASYFQSLALLVGLFPLICSADELTGRYYLKLGLAWSWFTDRADVSPNKPNDSSSVLFPQNDNAAAYSVYLNRGESYRAAVGLRFADTWRMEGGYLDERFQLSASHIATKGDRAFRRQGLEFSLWRDFSLATPMLRPYLGGGFSSAQTKLAADSESQWELYAGSGFGLVLSSQWVVDISYQYRFAPELEFNTDETTVIIPNRGQRWQLGLRYQFGPAAAPPIKDHDADGIADEHDRCPNTVATAVVDHYGCADSDGDGIIDPLDRCPNTPAENEVDSNGCMDSDNDGVKNSADQCPNSAQGERVLRNGCAARQSVGLESIQFAVGETELNDAAKVRLSAVATVMLASPRYRLAVQGHSDDSGDVEANYRLSRARARSVGAALMDLGVAAERIEIQAFGASMPVAENSTREGRARNRRVSLKVIRPK